MENLWKPLCQTRQAHGSHPRDDRGLLTEVTEEVSASGETVQLANINCPGQIVISGTREGVNKAMELAKEKGAKRALPLEVSGPFHSSLMKPAAEKLNDVLNEVSIVKRIFLLFLMCQLNRLDEPTEIKEKLMEQLYSPVLWEDSVKRS